MAALVQEPEALEYATEKLRADRGFVLAAVSQCGWSVLPFLSKKHRSDKEILVTAASLFPLADAPFDLMFDPEIVGDWEIMMAAVSNDGMSLHWAAEALKCDRDIVMMAVSQNGAALQCASAALRGDELMVKLASGSGGKSELEMEVTLLSGKCCRCRFLIHERGRKIVLRRCLSSLGLDSGLHTVSIATLLSGAAQVMNTEELQTSRVHTMKLVLTALKLL